MTGRSDDTWSEKEKHVLILQASTSAVSVTIAVIYRNTEKLPCRPWGTQMLRWRQSSLPKLEVWSMLIWRHLFANFVAFSMPGNENNTNHFCSGVKGWFCSVRVIYTPSQPGWGLGFSKVPGLAAKGIPLKTSTERKRPRGIFFPWTPPPSVCTTPS